MFTLVTTMTSLLRYIFLYNKYYTYIYKILELAYLPRMKSRDFSRSETVQPRLALSVLSSSASPDTHLTQRR